MEHSTTDRERCAAMVAALNAELGWHLEATQQQFYVATLLECGALPPAEADLHRLVIVFHQDHALVAALRNRTDPQHEAVWQEWCAQALRILRHHGLGQPGDAQVDVEDLAQEALESLVHALAGFRYASRFSTWAYAVISHSSQRYLRGLHAAKRSGPSEPIEHNEALELAARDDEQPETQAEGVELAALIETVLSSQADRRWREIFRLWAQEDLRLADIATRMHLSPSRVSVLLDRIAGLLRQHPAILAWLNDDTPADRERASGEDVPQTK